MQLRYGRAAGFKTRYSTTPSYSFFWVIPRHLNFMCRRFGTLFIGGKSRKDNGDEIGGVFIQEKVWFKNSLRQSEGGMTGKGRIRVEKQVVVGKVEACINVSKKRHCVGERKWSHGMVQIELLCFRRLSPFFKHVHKWFPGLA